MSFKIMLILLLGVLTNRSHSRSLKQSGINDKAKSPNTEDSIEKMEIARQKTNVTYGIYTNTSAEALKPLIDRIDKTHLLITEKTFFTDSAEKQKAIYNLDYSGIDEIGCSWSSKYNGREYTMCCNKDHQCISDTCYHYQMCGQTCQKPTIKGQLYNYNGQCCHTDSECISGFCENGICKRDCFIDKDVSDKINQACCENDNQCMSGQCKAGECVSTIVTNYIKFEKLSFSRDVALITLAALFLLVCVITGYCGFIKGRMNKLNKQIQKANHYENKLGAAIKSMHLSSDAVSHSQNVSGIQLQSETKAEGAQKLPTQARRFSVSQYRLN